MRIQILILGFKGLTLPITRPYSLCNSVKLTRKLLVKQKLQLRVKQVGLQNIT